MLDLSNIYKKRIIKKLILFLMKYATEVIANKVIFKK